ncbi:unnamed protein product, partial [Scytosiphon promiscuus]
MRQQLPTATAARNGGQAGGEPRYRSVVLCCATWSCLRNSRRLGEGTIGDNLRRYSSSLGISRAHLNALDWISALFFEAIRSSALLRKKRQVRLLNPPSFTRPRRGSPRCHRIASLQ